jgi:hypothetical protein
MEWVPGRSVWGVQHVPVLSEVRAFPGTTERYQKQVRSPRVSAHQSAEVRGILCPQA